MKGLELARRFFTDVALPAFKEQAPDTLGSMAFGLAGPGSECYGFDDEISRDHDWGPRDRTYLGTDSPPETIRDWLLLPEEALSLCINEEVFLDPLGSFTGRRRALLAYFPRDLWLKKIASRCRAIGERGQYNLWRALQRGESIAFHYHRARFARESAGGNRAVRGHSDR